MLSDYSFPEIHNSRPFILEIPIEIVTLILLHAETTILSIVLTCKYFNRFIEMNVPNCYGDRTLWFVLKDNMPNLEHILDCKLTHDEHILRQIISRKSLGPMMLMKYVTASVEPIKILFDENNISITDLFIYSTSDNCFDLYIIHKNQIKCRYFASFETETARKEYSDRSGLYTNLLVIKHNILRKKKFCSDFSFFFRTAPITTATMTVFLYPPYDPSNAYLHIKL